MHYAFSFLPLEVQASLKELLALGVPESAVDLLTDRVFKGIEAKTVSLQQDIERIEMAIDRRIDDIAERLANRLDDRLRTQNGDTNGMIVDIHTMVQTQEAATKALQAEFHTFGESVNDQLLGFGQRMDASENDRHALHEQNDRLEQKFDLLERDMRTALDRALEPDRVAELVAMIERHERILNSAGAHEAGS